MLRTAIALTLAASGALTSPARGVAAPVDEPVRVLIVGDSVTQGSAGDWTWRYRLWQSLRTQGVTVDFVGPRSDLFDNVASEHGSQAYADPAFDSDHAARWGAAFGFEDVPIQQLVATYEPDVVVEVLGVNNLTWFGQSAAQVVGDLERFVREARSVDPEVDIVASTVAHTWVPAAPDYNEQLATAATELTASTSPVVVAHPDVGFTQRDHTWDGTHANAAGEVLIAAAMADALGSLGVGEGYAGPIVVPLGPRQGASLQVETVDDAALLTWTSAPGVTTERLWQRVPEVSPQWHLVTETSAHEWTVSGLVEGRRYELRLQPVKGRTASDDVWSNTVVALDLPPAPDVVIVNRVVPRPRSLEVRWRGVPRAMTYEVRWSATGQPSTTRTRTTPGRTLTLRSLTPGKPYRVRVRAVGLGGHGPWSVVVTGRPRPAPAR